MNRSTPRRDGSADSQLGRVDVIIAALEGLGAVKGAGVKLPRDGCRSIDVIKAAGWAVQRLQEGPPFLRSQLSRLRNNLRRAKYIGADKGDDIAGLIEGLRTLSRNPASAATAR